MSRDFKVHWRHRYAQKFFLGVYYLVKVYTLRTSIYPTLNPIKNPIQGLRDFIKGFWIEVFRTLPEMRKTVTYPAPSPRLAERQNHNVMRE